MNEHKHEPEIGLDNTIKCRTCGQRSSHEEVAINLYPDRIKPEQSRMQKEVTGNVWLGRTAVKGIFN